MSAARKRHVEHVAPQRETGEVVAIGAQGLPEPLTPPGSYVGGEFMPVFHRDLRTSEVWREAPHSAKSICMDFWMMLWEATPACSVPKDENYIRKALGIADVRTWENVRKWVMQHLVPCRDGRLYHSKQAAYANKILARRRQKNGAKGGDTPGDLREIPGSTPGEPPERSVPASNENNGLAAQSARVGGTDNMESREEKNPPSEGAAAPARVEGGPPAVLTEEDRQRALRASLGQEWAGIVERIGPTMTAKEREILKNALVKHYGKGMDAGLQALQTLRDVERLTLTGKLIGYEACRDDAERTRVVANYLWAIIKKKPQQKAGARPNSRQEDLSSSFEEEARRRMGLEPGPAADGFNGTVIDGEAG